MQRAVSAIDGRWKLAILFRLFERPVLRFSELERDIGGISQKMLAQHLRELERDGLVCRTVHAVVPPQVDYRLTEAGRKRADAALSEVAKSSQTSAMAAVLTDDERQTLLRLCQKLLIGIEEEIESAE